MQLFYQKKYSLYVILVVLCFYTSAFSQDEAVKCGSSENKEAIKNLEKGTDKKKYKKEERYKFLEKAMELDPDYIEAVFAYIQERILTIKYEKTKYKVIDEYLLKVIEKCPDFHAEPYYYLGFSYYEQEKYSECITYLEKFIKFKADDEKKYGKDYPALEEQSKEIIKYAKIYRDLDELKKNPVPFDPQLVEGVCTQNSEYLPIISPDDEMILFTRRVPQNSKNTVYQSDKEVEIFSFSKRGTNGKFDKGSAMPDPYNKNSNEGGATVSIDNKKLFYTICKDEGGEQLNCDIYYSELVGGTWTEIKKVDGINDPVYFDSQPTLSADGKSLYFASDRKGGLGGIDIYKTTRDVTGNWAPPVNLGPKINTEGHDKSPFMHSDSETLYFSSDGQPGFGGFDIFYVRKDEKGEWLTPKNIGYPINSEADDLGFFVSTDGHYGYFASNQSAKVKGKVVGGWDIYSFELYKEARPSAVAFIKGEMKDEKGAALKNATVEIKSAKSKEKTEAIVDTTTGEFIAIVNMKKKEDFVVTVKKEGYAFNSSLVSIKEENAVKEPTKINFESKPVEVGKAYTLNNIYFNSNSSKLKEESIAVIEEFVAYLKDNPTIKIEVHGHTDNVGDEASNISLSTDRAFSVFELLQEKGIPKGRLVAFKGFGKAKPVTTNDTEVGRAKNRRTEFVVLEK
ncbi:MAG: OmpA family protein [Bacteroidetes bacterium]|nr:OmpA family protein [Bacteroidota bacterium]